MRLRPQRRVPRIEWGADETMRIIGADGCRSTVSLWRYAEVLRARGLRWVDVVIAIQRMVQRVALLGQ